MDKAVKQTSLFGDAKIPDKRFFRIGEVSHITGLKPYVLRYWETEFSDINPMKAGSGHRLYRRKDIELVLLIKQLLYKEKFTIAGAKKKLKTLKSSKRKLSLRVEESLAHVQENLPKQSSLSADTSEVENVHELLDHIRSELKDFVDTL